RRSGEDDRTGLQADPCRGRRRGPQVRRVGHGRDPASERDTRGRDACRGNTRGTGTSRRRRTVPRTGTGEAGAGPRRARAGRTSSGRRGQTLSLRFRRPVRTYGAAPTVCSRTGVAWVVDGPPTRGARSPPGSRGRRRTRSGPGTAARGRRNTR